MTDAEEQSDSPPAPVEEKPQAERKLIATLVQGTVKWFNVRNGYGFINRNDTKEDVFVHQTAIKKNNPRKCLRSVGAGEVVEFDVIKATKGSEAANVTGPGGTPVKGSRYAPDKRRFRRRFFLRSPRPDDPDRPDQAASEGEGRPESEGLRPAPRRRGPRRPRQEGEADAAAGVEPGAGDPQRRRRFRPPFRRQFRPRPPAELQGEQQRPEEEEEEEAAEQGAAAEEEATQADAQLPLTPGDLLADVEPAEAQGQRHRRQFRPRRPKGADSPGSKNGTDDSASEPGTPLPAPKPAEEQSSKSPRSSPKNSLKSPESPVRTVPTATE